MSKKLFNISLLRVVSTIMIVLGHSFCMYGVWRLRNIQPIESYTNFAVKLTQISLPLFFMISGFLLNNSLKRNPSKFINVIISRGKRVLIPYAFWGVFSFFIFSGVHKFNIDVLLKGIDHLWFLLALFWCFPISWIIIKMSKDRFWILNAFIVFSIILSIVSTKLTNYLCIDRAAYYLFFFLIGVWINIKPFTLKFGGKSVYTFSLLLIIVILHFSNRIDYNFLESYFLSSLLSRITILVFSIMIILLVYKLSLYINPKYNSVWHRVILLLDENSFGIYITHHIIIYAIVLILPIPFFSYFQVIPWAILVFAFPASLFITLAIKRTKFTFFIQ